MALESVEMQSGGVPPLRAKKAQEAFSCIGSAAPGGFDAARGVYVDLGAFFARQMTTW